MCSPLVFVILVDWWSSYGGLAIDLQRFARRVVGLCASSSGCERNWSTFEHVSHWHTFCYLPTPTCLGLKGFVVDVFFSARQLLIHFVLF